MITRWRRYALSVLGLMSLVTLTHAQSTLYVSRSGNNTPPYDSWTKAAHRIQDAINESQVVGATDILVAEDADDPYEATSSTEYRYPDDNDDAGRETIYFNSIVGGLAMRGGYLHEGSNDPEQPDGSFRNTILSGQDSKYHVVAILDSGSNQAPIVLDGFAITGGNATGANGDFTDDTTGCGLVVDHSTAQVENCFIHGNMGNAQQEGGGIGLQRITSLQWFGCKLTEIWDNHALVGSGIGLAEFDGGNPGEIALSHVEIHDNGLGIDPSAATPESLQGGGIYLGPWTQMDVTNCEIHDNLGETGAAVFVSENAVESTWRNCTIAYNHIGNFPNGTGGMFFGHSATTSPMLKHQVFNSISYFNQNANLVIALPMGATAGEVAVSYTCTTPVPVPNNVQPAPGMIDDDPLFVSTGRRDFRLQTDPLNPSPCIDAGGDRQMGGDPLDIDLDPNGDTSWPMPLDFGLTSREKQNEAAPDTGFDSEGGTFPPPGGDADPTSTDVDGAVVDIGAHEAGGGAVGPGQ